MFISDLVPDLVMEVPNLTDVQAMRALQRSFRRFYSESLLWRERRTYSVGEGTFVLRFVLPVEESSIIAIHQGYFEGEELPVLSEAEFLSLSQQPPANRPSGYMPRLADKTALVAPVARIRQDNSYAFTLTLTPTMDADELPLDAYSQFEDGYVAGALAYLYGTALFLNPPLAALNEAKFSEAVIRAQNVRDNLYSGPAKVTAYGGL